MKGVRGFGDPRAGDAAQRQVGVAPAEQRRRAAAVPSDRAQPRPAVPRRHAARLDDHAPGLERRPLRPVGRRPRAPTRWRYFTRNDIPFHYALADAFTVCDAYHCSLLGPTDPNRYHMWTGWVGNDGSGGGPVVDNAEAGYGWSTYPELLQAAGVTLEDLPGRRHRPRRRRLLGLDRQPLHRQLRRQLAAVLPPVPERAARLAAVRRRAHRHQRRGTIRRRPSSTSSRPTSPTARCRRCRGSSRRRPSASIRTGRPNYGAWYTSQVLEILTSNEKLWSKTALFITYDENDGFFDHVVPPTPPQTRAGPVDGAADQRLLRRQLDATRPARTASASACR